MPETTTPEAGSPRAGTGEAGPPDVVSVRYARQEYAIGYIHGRNDTPPGGRDDAMAFARFYLALCDAHGGQVSLHAAYQQWRARR